MDEAVTEKLRKEMRAERLRTAQPVAEWWAAERRKVQDGNFIEPVADMYRSSTSFAKFDREFREFWQLPDDHEI